MDWSVFSAGRVIIIVRDIRERLEIIEIKNNIENLVTVSVSESDCNEEETVREVNPSSFN